MARNRPTQFESRGQFLGVAAKAMRCILVDRSRRSRAAKRGGGLKPMQLDEALMLSPDPHLDLLAIDDAVQRLSRLDAVQGQIVELRFFGGLTVEETAEVLSRSPATVKSEWALAKAWLYRDCTTTERSPKLHLLFDLGWDDPLNGG